jgi:acyl carrier protein
MKNKVKEILAIILEVNVSEINDSFSQQSCSNWDSLNHLNLIIALEEAFDVSFDPEEISLMIDINNIIFHINNRTN